jgi:hypothetical protein
VEWLKVQALSSNPSTEKKKKKLGSVVCTCQPKLPSSQATWEAEIRRIKFQASLGKRVCEVPNLVPQKEKKKEKVCETTPTNYLNGKKLDVVVTACHPSDWVQEA